MWQARFYQSPPRIGGIIPMPAGCSWTDRSATVPELGEMLNR